MQNLNLTSPVRRRSSRVAANVPVLVTSKDPSNRFSEICQTMVVSAHGCLFRSPIKLDSGAIVQFDTEEGRRNTGRVVYCQPVESDQKTWKLAAQFDRPENFWGLKEHPTDWVVITAPATDRKLPVRALAKTPPVLEPTPLPPDVKDMLEQIRRQVSDERIRSIISQMLQPMQVEIAAMRERKTEAPRSKFEISLSQIPPEVEEQIEARLRKELSPKMLEQARQQSAEVLDSARNVITQETRKANQQFVQQITQQFQAAERRVQSVAEENAAGLREQVRITTGEIQQRVADASTRLKRMSDEFAEALQRGLQEQHESRRTELLQLQATIAGESDRLQSEVSDLNGRIQSLDGSVRRLESGLDKRLGQMASDTVTAVRTRLETEIDSLLKILESRGTQELGSQVDQARARLDIIRAEIENELSASLQSQVAHTIDSFERSLDDLAKQSLDQWRGTLSRSLNSVLRNLGDEIGSGR